MLKRKQEKKKRSLRSWHGRTEVDALCGLYVRLLNPTQILDWGNHSGPEKH